MDIKIRAITLGMTEKELTELSELLASTVNAGASVGFVQPYSTNDARGFWLGLVQPSVTKHQQILWVAEYDNHIVGTVQLILDTPPNQSHRCEIAKLMVKPDVRGHGIGRQLMEVALTEAKERSKSLITLDTRTGDVSQLLYQSLGFEIAGHIPNFALDPDGAAIASTTIMYKLL